MSDARFYIIEESEAEGNEGWFEVVDGQIDGVVAFTCTLTTAQVLVHALATSERYQDEVASWDGIDPDPVMDIEVYVNEQTGEEIHNA